MTKPSGVWMSIVKASVGVEIAGLLKPSILSSRSEPAERAIEKNFIPVISREVGSRVTPFRAVLYGEVIFSLVGSSPLASCSGYVTIILES